MGEKKQLGVYFSDDVLYFVETVGSRLLQNFSMLLTSDDINELENSGASPLITSNLSNKILNLLNEKQIITKEINLSLPIKDIIFRSFIVPWMQPHELEGVVQFEVNKYIPFRIEELKYSYHSNPITINGIKRIHVIFSAVRLVTLQHYQDVFSRIGFRINLIEPAANSLLRVLLFNKKYNMGSTLALIEKEGNGGKITIVDKGVPVFVREFQTLIPQIEKDTDPKVAINKFVNEVRVSLDYFSRQENHLSVTEVVLIDNEEPLDFIQNFKSELNLNASFIAIRTLIDNSIIDQVAYIKAYGACLDKGLSTTFDFSFVEIESQSISSQFDFSAIKPANYKITLVIGVVCLPIILISFIVKKIPLERNRVKIVELEKKLEQFKDVTADDIKNKITKVQAEVTVIKQISTKSQFAEILSEVSKNLPKQGVWLSQVTMTPGGDSGENKQDVAPQITISGYAFDASSINQMNLVGQFLENLKKDEALKKLYKAEDIYREGVNSMELNGNKVISFTIKLK